MTEPLTLFDDQSEHIRRTGHIYYDSTPGHTPTGRRNIPTVGTLVQVAHPRYVHGSTWTGRITSHIHWDDGDYTGLSLAECVDVGDFLHYLEAGRGYQVEAAHLRPVNGSAR